eukprot:c10175_g1_i1 orf=87-1091(+)
MERSEGMEAADYPNADDREGRILSSGCWAEMAADLLANIFLRLPMNQLLRDIPLVCKPWKLASQDPLCWKTLCFPQPRIIATPRLLTALLQRCNGVLQEVSLPYVQDPQCLQLLAHSAPLLQKLHIHQSCANDAWATVAAPLMPCISDLDLSMCENKFSHVALVAFGRNCKGITKLRRNKDLFSIYVRPVDDSEAFAIAAHYPLLEYLELRANPLSAQGLKAILDSCPLLVHLDLAGCPNVMDMDNTLLNVCQKRLKVFVEPSCGVTTSDDEYDSEDEFDDEDCWIDEDFLDGGDFEECGFDEYQSDFAAECWIDEDQSDEDEEDSSEEGGKDE